jgi:hypothetical protein
VREWLNKQRDVKADKLSDRFKKGVPDFLACVDGIYVAIELKREEGDASPHQRIFIEKVQRANGIGGTCYTLAEVIALVDKAREKSKQLRR